MEKTTGTAVLTYGTDKNGDSAFAIFNFRGGTTIAVIDFRDGTFYVSILEIRNSVVEAKSMNSKVLLGIENKERPNVFRLELRLVLNHFVKLCRQALTDAQLTAKEINEVILVGDSTRIPKVQEIVKEIFGKEPNKSVNSDEILEFELACALLRYTTQING